MNALERLFLLEVDFHRKLRTQALGKAMIDGLRTSYALQCGYEGLLRDVGPVTVRDIEKVRERLTMAGDSRDVLTARDSLMQLLGVRQLES
jgi:hypothetical protein